MKSKHSNEAFGIFLFAISLFLIISLYSHNITDNSFNNSSSSIKITNTGGIVGAYVSDILIQTFGSGSYLIPLIIIFLAWGIFWEKTYFSSFIILTGGSIGALFFCSLLSILIKQDPIFPDEVKAGGNAGWLMTKHLLKYFNTPGALIIIITSFFISIPMVTGISIKEFISRLYFVVVLLKKISKIKLPKIKIPKISIPKIKLSLPKRKARKPEIKKNLKVVVNNKKQKESVKEIKEEFQVVPENSKDYLKPSINILSTHESIVNNRALEKELLEKSNILLSKLKDFGILGNIIQVLPGPVITMYEFEPGIGIKVSRILSLSDDLALAMKAINVRIHAPVPGKSVVGIEIPNKICDPVSLKDIIDAEIDEFKENKLTIALGKDISGKPVVTNLATIPHLLVAGATGSGKSVGINSMICSILFNAAPDEVKFIMIDPKMLELSIYDGIPHLVAPVVTNPKKAAFALKWAVEEMENRYRLMSEIGTRNIIGYNQYVEEQAELEKNKKSEPPVDIKVTADGEKIIEKKEPLKKIPYIVVVIDELADLMMVASKEVETSLTRLAQMARAAGIHLLIATQRPSVDVLTGIIKANFPARISFQVTSRVDSRTILDTVGAEKLLGKGDMLFLPPGTSRVQRIHGAFVAEKEIKELIKYLGRFAKSSEKTDILKPSETDKADEDDDEESDEYYDQAVALVSQTRQASISMIQRRLRIGYNRAARIVEIMEKNGLVGPADGAKPREVYVRDIDNIESIN